MINDLLARLDNNPEAPYGWIWPSFTPKVFTPYEISVRNALIGTATSRELFFDRCLELVGVVLGTPLSGYVTARDPRVTYSLETIRNHFAVAGLVVSQTNIVGTMPRLNMVVTPDTPATNTWRVELLTPTSALATGMDGTSQQTTFSFSGGISTAIQLPGDAGHVLLTGGTPAAGQRWQLSYRQAGYSWLPEALAGMQDVDVAGLLNDELRPWLNSPVQLDRLCAAVVALGSWTDG